MERLNGGGQSEHNDLLIGEWTITPSLNLLLRGEEQVRVEPRVMDVLIYLAARPSQPVSKEELIDRIWQGRHVTDDVRTVSISALRKALADDARWPRYIETVSRRGYRLIAPVESVATTSVPVRTEPPIQPDVQRPPGFAWPRVAGAAAFALLAAGAMWLVAAARHTRHPLRRTKPT